jgi:hypothetical protein
MKITKEILADAIQKDQLFAENLANFLNEIAEEKSTTPLALLKEIGGNVICLSRETIFNQLSN